MNNDLISREWLKDAFDNLCCHDCKKCRNFRKEDSFYKCDLIENAPTVEQPQGEWIGINEYINHLEEETGERYKVSRLYDGSIFCNQCWKMNDKKSCFCPNCGAKMIN